jgi:hypothetical protein
MDDGELVEAASITNGAVHMHQVLPPTYPRRAGGAGSAVRAVTGAGAIALILAACTACVGGSTPSGAAGGSSSGAGALTTSAPAGPSVTTAASTAPTASTDTAAGGAGTNGSGSSGGSSVGSGSGATASANSGAGSGGGPTTCATSHLSAVIGTSQGAAGSVYVNVVFKNTGSQPCTLTGYPGVSLGAGNPVAQVGQPAARSPQATPIKLTLIPGAHAYAVVQVGDAHNWPSGTCEPTTTSYLRIYPPNNSSLLYVPYSSTGCRGDVVTLHVEAVQPGTGS